MNEKKNKFILWFWIIGLSVMAILYFLSYKLGG